MNKTVTHTHTQTYTHTYSQYLSALKNKLDAIKMEFESIWLNKTSHICTYITKCSYLYREAKMFKRRETEYTWWLPDVELSTMRREEAKNTIPQLIWRSEGFGDAFHSMVTY